MARPKTIFFARCRRRAAHRRRRAARTTAPDPSNPHRRCARCPRVRTWAVSVRRPAPRRATCDGRHPETFTIVGHRCIAVDFPKADKASRSVAAHADRAERSRGDDGGRHGRRGDARRLDDLGANAELLEERIADGHGKPPQPPPVWTPFAASSLRYSATGMPPQPQFSISTSWKTTQVHSGGFLSTSNRTWLTPL